MKRSFPIPPASDDLVSKLDDDSISGDIRSFETLLSKRQEELVAALEEVGGRDWLAPPILANLRKAAAFRTLDELAARQADLQSRLDRWVDLREGEIAEALAPPARDTAAVLVEELHRRELRDAWDRLSDAERMDEIATARNGDSPYIDALLDGPAAIRDAQLKEEVIGELIARRRERAAPGAVAKLNALEKARVHLGNVYDAVRRHVLESTSLSEFDLQDDDVRAELQESVARANLPRQSAVGALQ